MLRCSTSRSFALVNNCRHGLDHIGERDGPTYRGKQGWAGVFIDHGRDPCGSAHRWRCQIGCADGGLAITADERWVNHHIDS